MKTQRISKRQALLISITAITSAVFRPVLSDYLQWAGNGAWVAIILATGFSILLFLLMIRLCDRFPQQSAAEYLPQVWGKLLGYPLVGALLLIFLLRAALTLRNISEFFVAEVLPETPISAVIIVMLLLVIAGILTQLEGIVRFNQLALPIILLGLGLVFLATLPRMSGWYLLPLLDKGFGGLLFAFRSSSGHLSASAYLLFAYPLIVDQDHTAREGSKTLAIAGGILLATYLNIVLFFSAKLGQVFTWPYMLVVKNLQLGVERGEALFLVGWMLSGFVTTCLFLYVFALGVCQLIPRLKVWWVGIGGALVATYISLVPDNLPRALVDYSMLNQYSVLVVAAITLLSLGMAMLRRLRGAQHA